MAFVLPIQCRKLVLTSAASKWREFKSKLTKWYILPYKDDPELLQFPPDDYRSIEQADWDIFVDSRLTDSFQVCKKKLDASTKFITSYLCNEKLCYCMVMYTYVICRNFVRLKEKKESRISTLI